MSIKKLSSFIKSIRNLIPYFGLITIYFFFINLEATKDKRIINQDNINLDSILGSKKYKKNGERLNNNNLRISIPVIPYEDKSK